MVNVLIDCMFSIWRIYELQCVRLGRETRIQSVALMSFASIGHI